MTIKAFLPLFLMSHFCAFIYEHFHKNIANCIRGEGCKKIVVISNDTDVVLLLHYISTFMTEGSVELWIKFGAGEKGRCILIHILAEKLGKNLLPVIVKAPVLTGCDVTSKVGTNQAALKGSPERFLQTFGNDFTPTILIQRR